MGYLRTAWLRLDYKQVTVATVLLLRLLFKTGYFITRFGSEIHCARIIIFNACPSSDFNTGRCSLLIDV